MRERIYWCKVGMSITVSDAEYETLCGEDGEVASDLLVEILRNPVKSKIDGDTYFLEDEQFEDGCEAICANGFQLHEV